MRGERLETGGSLESSHRSPAPGSRGVGKNGHPEKHRKESMDQTQALTG